MGRAGDEYEAKVVAFLSRADVVDRAYRCQVVWAKIGSYPHWPAQIVRDDALDSDHVLNRCARAKDATVPVMFFGELTYSWIKPKGILTWSEGVEKGFMRRKSATIRQGIEQVKMFLEVGQGKKGRVAGFMEHWWCHSPVPVLCPWPCVEQPVQQQEANDVCCIPIVDGKIKMTDRFKQKMMSQLGDDVFRGKNAFPEYTHLRQNFWNVPRPKRLSKEDSSVCCCSPGIENCSGNVAVGSVLSGCGHECLNRLSYIHCDQKTCPCGILCANKPFHQLEMPKMEVFLTSSKGWGVKAAETIPCGTFIVEYTGEVIDTMEMTRRMEESRVENFPHFYMMEMAPGMVIDARKKGNIARLLNSSCDPNCITQKWRDASTGEIRVGIFAKRDVQKGEELVYDYNFEHILEGGSKKYTCQCGAANCRGSIDTNQRQSSTDVGRRVEIWWDGDACYYAGKVSKYESASGLSTIAYDDGFVESIHLRDHEYRWVEERATKRRKRTLQQPDDCVDCAKPQQVTESFDRFLRSGNREAIEHLHLLIDLGTTSALSDSLLESPQVSLAIEMYDALSAWWQNISASLRDSEILATKRQLAEALDSLTAMPPAQITEPVENPGAEQTAGSLHGNGIGEQEAVSVSSRGRKRQKKIFGTDFEQDMEAMQQPKSRGDASSPARERPRAGPKQSPMSPGMEAATIIAQMSRTKPDEKRSSKSKSASKGSGPTPPSSGLPARTILVAKRLTNSDVTKGRILLPRAAVEANLSFAVGRAHSLVAKDHEGNSWEFTLQSWANGIETRRVFVLEHAGDYIRYHQLKIEDVIGISTTEEGEFMIEFNTIEVCSAAESQQAARAGGQTPAVNTALPAILPGSINPLIQQNSGRCTRSIHCNKPAGHPGFCMRTPASARGKKQTLPRGRGRGRGRGKKLPLSRNPYHHAPEESDDDDERKSGDSAPDSEQPGSARMGRHDSGEDDIFRRGGVLTPRFPNSAYEYFAQAKPENEYDEGYMEGLHDKPHQKEQSSSRGPQLPKYPLPPPPELGPGIPPIFVMAQDSTPQYPPQLRSPLRPSIQGRQRQGDQGGQGNPPIPCSPSAAIANVPNMGLKDDLDGSSPHAFHSNPAGDMMKLGAAANNPNSSDYLSILEGASPTAAKFELMVGAAAKGQASSSAMPAAPLPLFGAPPPPLGTEKVRGTSSAQETGSSGRGEKHLKDTKSDADDT